MQDFLLNLADDIGISQGDFDIGFSDFQHQKSIVISNKGEWKQHPEVGVGMAQILGDDLYTEMLIEAKKQLQYDGMQIENIFINKHGKLIIEGKYGNETI